MKQPMAEINKQALIAAYVVLQSELIFTKLVTR